jgi:hypothetical protein
MAQVLEQPEVLHASDTADTAAPNNPIVVRETRPIGAPIDQTATAVEEQPTTYAERQVFLRRRHGGMHLGADFLGFTLAMFFSQIFLGIVSVVGYGLHTQVPTLGGVIPNRFVYVGIGGLVAAFLAYMIGGYAAARMARFDGVLNGIGVWLWTLIVGIILGAAGWYFGVYFDAASEIHTHASAATRAATIGALSSVTLVVMLLGTVIGGGLGERYHRRIDRDAEAL